MSDYHLTVTRAFGKYRPGDHVEDAAEIAAILDGENRHAVVKVHADKQKPWPASQEPKTVAAATSAPVEAEAKAN